jgi:DNA-directed RNA polymerase alpha subunit
VEPCVEDILVSELQDLKNYILSIQQQLNNLTTLIQSHAKKDDNLNEILNLVHNQNFEKARFNQSLFENVFPDLVQRISALETKLHINRRLELDNERALSKSIHELGLLPRTVRGLMAEDIRSVNDLIKKSKFDLLKIPNFGTKSLRDIEESLSSINLKLSHHKE